MEMTGYAATAIEAGIAGATPLKASRAVMRIAKILKINLFFMGSSFFLYNSLVSPKSSSQIMHKRPFGL
jgi:hypothetical protein